MSDPDDMVELAVVENDPFWTNYVTGFRLGDSLIQAWSIEPKLAFVDSGTSCLFMDPVTFQFFINRLSTFTENGVSLNQEDQYELNDCKDRDKMPSVSLMYGDHWFTMFVADYVYERDGVCKICIYG
mmetsp:Transcript_39591/g.51877  ORF Transcript_39591/g.51877 Transcript_39591/m.51877 type:complete len:127 (+) Transcript_39591:805-1185(+)|eukprot:CAMPEP_0185576826 /NCGR_PEP_ID=MMETSP0434-20130131/7670_1 /TAXON_ID=626734 ORGANISM="Favella taraikaensis, Strain Fe Narragansett Bay" /NCGR_SAMPLE_ID=MMETSP0434 /ASSEMBLY_ACC=CAM_ASM_000379 /LENGTH=126 /DNA_ID=CAMNT_0028194189 /DNA_START=776 /DNA_END=1156 /DNA_ORIENTATION=+